MAMIDEKNTPLYRVCEWLALAQDRFKNMYHAGKDYDGWPAINKAIEDLNKNGYLTVGQFTYLFDRTHSLGKYPHYNTKFGYNKKYGNMKACCLTDIIDSDIVKWDSGLVSQQVKQAIAEDTEWTWQQGTLKRKPATLAQVFD